MRVTPRYDGGLQADRGPELTGTTTALLVLATVFVGLRFWARYTVRYELGLDDLTVMLALVFAFITGAINYSMITQGLGRHASTLPLDQLTLFFKLLLAFECIYVTSITLVKLSLLVMYKRIFPGRTFRLASIALGSVIIGWWISIVAVSVFQCKPISKAWLPSIEGTCINLKASFIGNAVPNILTDIGILCLPMTQVWHLKVTWAQRISLCAMFLLGGFVLFASIYRFTTIMQFSTADTTWTLATACTWCVVEVACGVISACLPTLRPLMMKISTQFGSISRKTGLYSGARSGLQGSQAITELRTLGGGTGVASGTKQSKQFTRIEDEEKYGVTTVAKAEGGPRPSYLDKSGSVTPNSGIRIQVDRQLQWSEKVVDQGPH
ncbi:uncharacterized protein BCR38DRAFT_383396 [Pseudomassariella vexata]|uniref:Rhodopsin domain-containing protein n=1 Tax=Pseudomassariella vexata TaxID=1141098 RepID=A0A1Y2EKU2_9PEZI|nr:uncharacterized protein BCR38DRAFT_383396 [Pseudomassariella vexata]ORY72149.1 hypothetical protein BCR38DRAFT_383396 [Pseudomassariella vexata]